MDYDEISGATPFGDVPPHEMFEELVNLVGVVGILKYIADKLITR